MCSAEKGFTVRVPELRSSTTLAIARCEKHGKEVLCLDNAFSLIEGHPHYCGIRAFKGVPGSACQESTRPFLK